MLGVPVDPWDSAASVPLADGRDSGGIRRPTDGASCAGAGRRAVACQAGGSTWRSSHACRPPEGAAAAARTGPARRRTPPASRERRERRSTAYGSAAHRPTTITRRPHGVPCAPFGGSALRRLSHRLVIVLAAGSCGRLRADARQRAPGRPDPASREPDGRLRGRRRRGRRGRAARRRPARRTFWSTCSSTGRRRGRSGSSTTTSTGSAPTTTRRRGRITRSSRCSSPRSTPRKGWRSRPTCSSSSTIPEENFEKERKIVLEELARDRNDPSYDDRDRTFAPSRSRERRSRGPVLGHRGLARGDHAGAGPGDYYKARYVPGNMTLVVMGDFEIEEMLAPVKRTFGAAKAGPSASEGIAGELARCAESRTSRSRPREKGPARLLAAFPFDVAPWDDTTVAAEVLLAAASDGDGLAAGGSAYEPRRDGRRAEPRLSAAAPPLVHRRPRYVEAEDGADPERDPRRARRGDPLHAARRGGARARSTACSPRRPDAAIARDQIHYFAMLRSSSIPGSPKGSLESEAARLAALTSADWDAASARLIAGLPAVRARVTGPGLARGARVVGPPPDARAAPRRDFRLTRRDARERAALRRPPGSSDSDVFAMHVAFAPRSAAEARGGSGITDCSTVSWRVRDRRRGTLDARLTGSARASRRRRSVRAVRRLLHDARVLVAPPRGSRRRGGVRRSGSSPRWFAPRR